MIFIEVEEISWFKQLTEEGPLYKISMTQESFLNFFKKTILKIDQKQCFPKQLLLIKDIAAPKSSQPKIYQNSNLSTKDHLPLWIIEQVLHQLHLIEISTFSKNKKSNSKSKVKRTCSFSRIYSRMKISKSTNELRKNNDSCKFKWSKKGESNSLSNIHDVSKERK